MATKLSAKEDKLGIIHDLTAEYCLNRLRPALSTGEHIHPSELGAITKFLKDNGIECTKEDMEQRFGPIMLADAPEYEELEEDFG